MMNKKTLKVVGPVCAVLTVAAVYCLWPQASPQEKPTLSQATVTGEAVSRPKKWVAEKAEPMQNNAVDTKTTPVPEADLEADSVELDTVFDIGPFPEAEALERYEAFFADMREGKLNEEQIQQFFEKMRATLEESPLVQQQISDLYRSYPEDFAAARGIIAEMLAGTQTGVQMLLKEADHINALEQEALYPEMLQLKANFSEEIELDVLEKAFDYSSGDHGEALMVSSWNYIATVERLKDTPNETYTRALDYLKDVSVQGRNDNIQSLALQKLYRITPPALSAKIALDQIRSHNSVNKMIETLMALQGGDIEQTKELELALVDVMQQEPYATELNVEVSRPEKK